MRVLATVFITLLTIVFVGLLILWLQSSDASLRIAFQRYDTDSSMRFQRYIQFSGQPGVILYGNRVEIERLNPVGLMVPEWEIAFRKLLDHEIEERDGRPVTAEAQNKPNLSFGYTSSEHGNRGSDFYAVYRYFSIPHLVGLIGLFVLVLSGAVFLHRKK